MTLIAAPIFVGGMADIDPALERAERAVAAGARLIEWRTDALAEASGSAAGAAARRLVRESPAPCIVTCRPAKEGGAYEGPDHIRRAFLERIATDDLPPRYVDIELASIQRDAAWRGLMERIAGRTIGGDRATSVILSTHDFNRRPSDLLQRIEAMSAEPGCAVIKVAWWARSVRDNLEAFELLRNRTKPMVALCMGPFGLMSRVLAGKFGGLLTFAVDAAGTETAPGQPTLDELRRLYRFDGISAGTKIYGVIGWPVEQSLGPVVHNEGFAAVEHDAVYLPLPVPPEYEHFKATVGSLIDERGLNFRGASVTIPHKENLLRFVRERGGRIDPAAEQIGAANTLVAGSAGGLTCTNTDSAAAVDALCGAMESSPAALAERTIAVIGAGGAARAVVAGLSRTGAAVVIFNRTRNRAEELAAAFHGRDTDAGRPAHVVVGREGALNCDCFDIIINCTPIGMAGGPAPHDSPLDLHLGVEATLKSSVTVFDTIYQPRQTPLLEEAQRRGARTINGMEMFLRQASAQFRAWTGFPAPLERFRRVAERR